MAWLYKRGNVWWIGWRQSGKQYLRPTGKTDRKEADKDLATHEVMEKAHSIGALTDEFYQQLTGRVSRKVLLQDYLDSWLKESEPLVSPRTIVKYQQVRREFLTFTGAESSGLLLEEVTSDHVKGFLMKRRERAGNTTVAGFRRILRSIFLQAQEEGKIATNPVLSANRKGRGRGMGKQQTERRPFTLEEIGDLYRLADPFWKWMILAGFFTGQRLGDLITMQRCNVDLGANLISLTSRKTDTRVKVPIAARLRKEFLHFPQGKPDEYFWPEQAERYIKSGASSFSQDFFELMAAAGMVQPRDSKKKASGVGRASKREKATLLGFHNLRHTFISQLKLAGGSQAVAKELAGHRTDAISDLYTHTDINALAKAVNALPEVVK